MDRHRSETDGLGDGVHDLLAVLGLDDGTEGDTLHLPSHRRAADTMAAEAPDGPLQLVILGGSYAGLSTAHYLLRHAVPALAKAHPSSPKTYEVVLVSPSETVLCRPACPRALLSDKFFDQDKLFTDIPAQFTQYPAGSFRFVHGTVTALDHVARTVTVCGSGTGTEVGDEETIGPYHALVLATGASTPSPLLGITRDDVFLRRQWAAFRAALPGAKTIVIAGGGPAGVETAGELGEFLNGRPGWFSTPRPSVRIVLVTSGERLLPALRASLAVEAERLLKALGVDVLKATRVMSVSPAAAGTSDVAAKAVVSLDQEPNTIEADLYIPATGTTPNSSFVDASLLAPDGRVQVDPRTLRVSAPAVGARVYAVGDVSTYGRPAIHLAFNAIPVLGANIKRDLFLAAGLEPPGPERVYEEDKTETQLVPIGTAKGVGAAMGWRVPSWLVWAIKGRDYWLWTTGSLWSGKQWAKEA